MQVMLLLTGRATRNITKKAGLHLCLLCWVFQAAGAAPIVLGHRVEKPETIATAIRIGNPASWKGAVAARDESGGRIEAVTDEGDTEGLQPYCINRRDIL